ncbi:hypothetical protein B7R78_0019145 [Ralstonia solanacearum]|nr:hypothetical protein [Ralstonia solanacearum]QOK84643.1 hypothetical protein HF906_21585 [Ralstonia solanacearum]
MLIVTQKHLRRGHGIPLENGIHLDAVQLTIGDLAGIQMHATEYRNACSSASNRQGKCMGLRLLFCFEEGLAVFNAREDLVDA